MVWHDSSLSAWLNKTYNTQTNTICFILHFALIWLPLTPWSIISKLVRQKYRSYTPQCATCVLWLANSLPTSVSVVLQWIFWTPLLFASMDSLSASFDTELIIISLLTPEYTWNYKKKNYNKVIKHVHIVTHKLKKTRNWENYYVEQYRYMDI